MAKKRYYCAECRKRIVPAGGGYWRHVNKPWDGYVPSPNISKHENNEALKMTGDIMLAATHPALYAAKKTIEFGVDIYKKLKDDD